MIKTKRIINNKLLECYESSMSNKSSRIRLIGALGIPRGAENDKNFTPGVLISSLLDRVGNVLKEAYVVGVDGLGGSCGDTYQTTLARRAADIYHCIINQPDGEKAWLVGHSMGAATLLLALTSIPNISDYVTGMTLLAPAAYVPGSENCTFGPEFKEAIQNVNEDALWYTQILAMFDESISVMLYLPLKDAKIPSFISEEYAQVVDSRATGSVHYIQGAAHGFSGLSDAELELLVSSMSSEIQDGIANHSSVL